MSLRQRDCRVQWWTEQKNAVSVQYLFVLLCLSHVHTRPSVLYTRQRCQIMDYTVGTTEDFVMGFQFGLFVLKRISNKLKHVRIMLGMC